MQLEKNKNAQISFAKLLSKKVILPVVLLLIIVGGYKGSIIVRSHGYEGLWDFISTVATNYLDGMDAAPESISIEIKDKDLKILQKNREQALERGVIINDADGDYVPGSLEYKGKKIKIKLRLKGHMTDHLQDDKWSFRIKVKDKDSFMGMKRFSIQHPGTRGYVYEWIYHELMKKEDVIALRYSFINVMVNGKDWGIYAVEENFDKELIENNSRKSGPIIRFDPDLYWMKRYDAMLREYRADEFASYYSANPQAYREEDVLADSAQKQNYLKAIALVEGLRSKKLLVDQAFDIEKMARFHAVIDLVGGYHSLDWSDVKYYYNPVTAKLEPVAYESFTDLGAAGISGLYNFIQLDDAENYPDWHTMIFSNRLFYAAYIKQLERMTEAEYLDAFFKNAEKDLKKNLSILHKEFPYKKFDKNDYYKRQTMIKKILDPPKAIHAYFNKIDSSNVVHIHVGAIDALPVELKSISINGMNSKESKFILHSKQKNDYVNYSDHLFVMPPDFKWKANYIDSIQIKYSVLGARKDKEIKVFPFPHTDSEFIATELLNRKGNVSEFSFLETNELAGTITMKHGKNVISKDMIIPSGFRLIINAGTSIDIANGSMIISYSPVLFLGNDDDQIVVSFGATSQGMEVIAAAGSKLKNVVFNDLPRISDTQWKRSGGLTFYESDVEFYNCSFYSTRSEDAVNLIRSNFLFKECLFKKTSDDALDIDYSDGVIENCVFEDCGENALDLNMSKVELRSVYINSAGNKALNVKAGSQLTGGGIKIKNSNIGLSAEDMSFVSLKKLAIFDCVTGIAAYKNKPGGGHPTILILGYESKGVKKAYLKDEKSLITVDSKEWKESSKDVENTIKREGKANK